MNFQAHHSAVAAAVALADAEEKGEKLHSQAVAEIPNAVQMRKKNYGITELRRQAAVAPQSGNMVQHQQRPRSAIIEHSNNHQHQSNHSNDSNGRGDVHFGGSSSITQQRRPAPTRKPRPMSSVLIAPIECNPQCFYCLVEASNLCNWCREVYYCGPNHYQIHRWKSKCWPFKVKGMYVVHYANLYDHFFSLIQQNIRYYSLLFFCYLLQSIQKKENV